MLRRAIWGGVLAVACSALKLKFKMHDDSCYNATVFTEPLTALWSAMGCEDGPVYNTSVRQEVFNIRCRGGAMHTTLAVTGCPATAHVGMYSTGGV